MLTVVQNRNQYKLSPETAIIEEDNIERSKWPLARVRKLFYEKDGVVRSVQLKTKDSTLHMPDAKLFVLEEAT